MSFKGIDLSISIESRYEDDEEPLDLEKFLDQFNDLLARNNWVWKGSIGNRKEDNDG